MSTVVIQCALPVEFEALLKAVPEIFQDIGLPEKQVHKKRDFFKIDLKKSSGDFSIVALRGGIGKISAAASAECAVEFFKPELLIDFGLCGALDPSLQHGDVIIANKIIEYDVLGFKNLPYVELKSAQDLASDDFKIGVLLSGDRNVVSGAERAALFDTHKALGACWEAAAVARVAKFHGLDCWSFRAVSDTGSNSDSMTDLMTEFTKHAPATAKNAATRLLSLLASL